MLSARLLSGNPVAWETVKGKVFPKLTKDEIHELETGNLWMVYRIAGLVCILDALILCSALQLCRGDLTVRTQGLLSVTTCLGVCLFVVMLTRKWQRTGGVSSGRIQMLIEILYWVMSIWGMLGSYRHYVAGEQMLVLNTVQVCFALMVSWYPIRSLLHFAGVYGGFYAMLLHFDGAAQVQAVNYFAMALMVLSANLLRFRRELLCVRLQLAQRNQIQDLESVSSHDGLTGLRNRYALRQDYPGYVGKTIWVVMADIDFFKQYNDSYGHGVGDQLLVAIGESIREEFGSRTTYRYGGDEFLIVVEDEDCAAVRERLKRWEREVALITVETAVERVRPRCSYGMSGGCVGSEAELREMMRRADERLYEAKGIR